MKKFLALLLLFSALITQAQESFFRGNNNFVAPTLTVPTLAATTAASSITRYTASSGGTILSNGGSTILESGICWGTSTPTISNNKTTDGGSIGNFTSTLSGLTAGITYYVRAYATNSAGTSYGSVQTFTTTPTVIIPAVGASYGGGIVGYVYQNGDPGFTSTNIPVLITSTTPQGYTRWYNGSAITTGATADILGSGFVNTNSIISIQGAVTTSYAAGVARAFNGGGYTDWYLPSKEELNKLYVNRSTIGGFAGNMNYFWTSTESSNSTAKMQNFLSGGAITDFAKSAAGGYVRAVRTIALSPIITPIITTSTSSGITATEASITSSVTDEGLTQVSSRGFVYGTTTGSSTFSVTNGSGAGSYTSTLSGLTSATTYYVRSFATNTQGTAYGAEKSFTTSPAYVAPTIATTDLVLNLDAGHPDSYTGSGTTWTDVSNNNNSVTLPSILATSYSATTGGGSFTFNSNNAINKFSSTSINNWNINTTNAISVETWIKYTSNGGLQFYFQDVALNYRFGFDQLGHFYYDLGSHSDRNPSSATLTADTWHHLVITAGKESTNGDRVKSRFYIDGSEVYSNDEGITSLPNITTPYYFGDDNNHYYPLNANVGVIRVYKKALSQSDITLNFNAQKARFGFQ